MSKPRNGFDPDPPECFSQVLGAAYSEACSKQADAHRRAGRAAEAEQATTLALYYGGFVRLVR